MRWWGTRAESSGIDSHPPIAVGGVGGSGTRLVAELLTSLGVFMGGDLNDAGDNLWFTLLLKRPELVDKSRQEELRRAFVVFEKVMAERRILTPAEESYVRLLAADDRPPQTAEWLAERAASLGAFPRSHRALQSPWG